MALLAYAITFFILLLNHCINPSLTALVHNWNGLVRSGGLKSGADISLHLTSQNATSHFSVQSKITSFLVSAMSSLEIVTIHCIWNVPMVEIGKSQKALDSGWSGKNSSLSNIRLHYLLLSVCAQGISSHLQ